MAENATSDFSIELTQMANAILDSDEKLLEIESAFGTHPISYNEDEEGYRYALIGFYSPLLAEIDSETYGTLHGFRVYLGDEG